MISLQNVTKQYKGITNNKDSGIFLWIKNIASLTGNKATSITAINSISFTVNKGEIFGVYGSNGAGKTTLIKLLSGLIAPTSGTVEIDGQTDIRRIKDTVSYISTNGWMGLEWQLTARENLMLYGNIFGLSGKTLERKCDNVLRVLGMDEAKNKYISELSAGMRQKITIARGLILDRPIIFYDEPSVSLDIPSARNLRELIKTDAEENHRTAIIASHNPEDLAVCGRIMLLASGEIIGIGSMDELTAPFSDIQTIEISCLNTEKEILLKDEPGVIGITYENIEGKHDVLGIKIIVRRNEFSFDRLVDLFIDLEIPVISIKQKEITIQEIYNYYLEQKWGEANANAVS